MPAQNRKTVISRPVKHKDLRRQTPSKHAILDVEKEKKQWNKTALKSIKNGMLTALY